MDRPDHLPIKMDDRHAFFYAPLRVTDPDGISWERWFQATQTRYERREVGGKFQLYVHHSMGDQTRERWCCNG